MKLEILMNGSEKLYIFTCLSNGKIYIFLLYMFVIDGISPPSEIQLRFR